MTIYEKDYKSLKEMIEGKTYNECKDMFDIILETNEFFDFNYKSLTCTIYDNKGRAELSKFVECWGKINFCRTKMDI